ncbi:uncharacterized protein [Medicago truncatula]|uniref:uncharacterized protein n=1 Tax=Medicago truncatula TaxID=3880 RepID=UPI000D2F1B81|nr:uncharacterized protein LOC112419227 [Medicago truncatula]
MKEIMGITDRLCQALQQKSQDILNVMQLVSYTKTLIQKLRDDGWDDLLKNELNHRFCPETMELLILSNSLVPKDVYKAFDIDNICALVHKFYPLDFGEQDKKSLRYHLHYFHLDDVSHPGLNKLSTMSELCEALNTTRKADTHYLVDCLIRLILTLPVSTATTERSFSAMKLIKTRLRNKMEDEFLADSMMLYIEKEIADQFSTDSIIDEFKSKKDRTVKF